MLLTIHKKGNVEIDAENANESKNDGDDVCLSAIKDESHLLLRSHLTMEDLESEDFKVHDPCVAWLNGKNPCCDS